MHNLAILTLLACNGPNDPAAADTAASEGIDDPFISGRACPPDSAVTWESFGQGFVLSHCAGCHSSNLGAGERAEAPIEVNMETQDLVQEWLIRIYARSADENATMPPVDSVLADERVLLGDWLACGAP